MLYFLNAREREREFFKFESSCRAIKLSVFVSMNEADELREILSI